MSLKSRKFVEIEKRFSETDLIKITKQKFDQ